MENIYRHGDLSFHAVPKLEGEMIAHDGSFVLAVGEHTNHKHVITGDFKVYKTQIGETYLMVGNKMAVITHEEHKPITVAPGTYQMKNEREFDYFLGETRRVQD